MEIRRPWVVIGRFFRAAHKPISLLVLGLDRM